jgi:hypothetical protein
MKVTVIVVCSNSWNSVQEYIHTGYRTEPSILTFEREIEIPQLREGWGIEKIAEKGSIDPHQEDRT